MAGIPERYDALVLDAVHKQSLASARSLGRAGLRVALGETFAEYPSSLPVPAFRSRYCAKAVVLPSYGADPAAFADALADFVRAHQVRVVLPTGDGVIVALAPYRARLAELGCVLAVASDDALAIATDKDRTLAAARELGIAGPKSVLVNSVTELAAAYAELRVPLRGQAHDLVDRQGGQPSDARGGCQRGRGRRRHQEVHRRRISACSPRSGPAGRREGVSLFIAGGEVAGELRARGAPHQPAARRRLGLAGKHRGPRGHPGARRGARQGDRAGGACARSSSAGTRAGRPLLMEINPRLAGHHRERHSVGHRLPADDLEVGDRSSRWSR